MFCESDRNKLPLNQRLFYKKQECEWSSIFLNTCNQEKLWLLASASLDIRLCSSLTWLFPSNGGFETAQLNIRNQFYFIQKGRRASYRTGATTVIFVSVRVIRTESSVIRFQKWLFSTPSPLMALRLHQQMIRIAKTVSVWVCSEYSVLKRWSTHGNHFWWQ